MAWAWPLLRKAMPTMNPPVAVTIARRAALFFRALTAIGCVPPVQCVSRRRPAAGDVRPVLGLDRGMDASGPLPWLPHPSSVIRTSLPARAGNPRLCVPREFSQLPRLDEGILRPTSNCVKFGPRFLSCFFGLTCMFGSGGAVLRIDPERSYFEHMSLPLFDDF